MYIYIYIHIYINVSLCLYLHLGWVFGGMFVCLFWPRHTACRILVPRPGIKSRPSAVLTTGLPENSQYIFNYVWNNFFTINFMKSKCNINNSDEYIVYKLS